MPPHTVYLEPYVGTGYILRHKLPSAATIAIDRDPAAPYLATLQPDHIVTSKPGRPDVTTQLTSPGNHAIIGDAISWILSLKPAMHPGWLLYIDPPYLADTRRNPNKPLYRFEFNTPIEHITLLTLLRSLPASIILSGYTHPLYTATLTDWRQLSFPTVDRRGNKRTECLWCNFPTPPIPHDVRYLGKDFRERERIKRKRTRWINRLRSMPVLDRIVILDAIRSTTPDLTAVAPKSQHLL